MEFNEIWTKEKNDQLRQMIKEHKSSDEIHKFFGDELKHHPKKKYSYDTVGRMIRRMMEKDNDSHIKKFYDYVNEIFVSPQYTEYKIEILDNNYILSFNIDEHKYVIFLQLIKIKNIYSYNVLFTTKEQFDIFLSNYQKINNGDITEDEFEIVKKNVEKLTDYNEFYKIIKSITFILFDFYPNIKGSLLSLGDTENKSKIRSYRNIIMNSFSRIGETKDIDSMGNIVYYYKIMN